MRAFLLATLLVFFTVPGLAANDQILPAATFPMQGYCPSNGLNQFPPRNINPEVSLWSCSGESFNPLDFSFINGAAENCLYIDNFDQKAFFVPLRTWTEWNAFKQSTLSGTLKDRVRLVYGCPAATVSNTCGGTADLPASRHATAVTINVDDRTLVFTCNATAGCGTWDMTSAEGYCGVDGLCGAASGVETTTAPTSNLCAAGEPSTVSGSGPWDWTCYGEHGGNDAFCSASPPPCTPSWYVTGYGGCSKSCGGGTQAVYWADGCGGAHTSSQSCNTQPCLECSALYIGVPNSWWQYIGSCCNMNRGGCSYGLRTWNGGRSSMNCLASFFGSRHPWTCP